MKQLENSYNQSLKTINDKISKLQFDIDGLNEVYDWLDDDDPEKIKIKSQIQSKIYQKRYQQALQGQVDDILDKLHTQNYTAVNEYLSGCYNDGYIATMYDLHGQGIPLIMPIDQESVVKAVQLDSKISTTLYTRIGENVDALKKSIAAEVSRGIVTGATYAQVAQQIKLKMTGTYNTKGGAYGRALTIARTEGHRIQVQAGMDACIKAKEMGCDVVKQWDSTLDGKTRHSHRMVDGEIRELEKPFSNNLMFPGDSKGKAGEVVNCRCALLQRVKWALDEGELQTLRERAEYYGLDKTENFEDFKEKYLKAVETADNITGTADSFIPAKSVKDAEKYASKFGKNISYSGITDVDAVNEVNRTLEILFERYPVNTLTDIRTNGRLKSAMARAHYTGLEISTGWLKDAKNATSTTEAWSKIVANHKKMIAQYSDLSKYPPSMHNKIKKYVSQLEEECKYIRGNVGVDIFSVISHEYGHIIADQYCGQINGIRANSNFGSKHIDQCKYIKQTFQKAKKTGDIYGVSVYGATDEYEFFAETFCMHMKGEKLPDYIDDMMKKVLNDGKL